VTNSLTNGQAIDFAGTFHRAVDAIQTALVGKRDTAELALTCLLAQGHLLIEDVPGVGKTTLARALAQVLGLSSARVQFTADLLPSDLLGGSVLDRATGQLTFQPGPIFTNVLVADEINRASPKTQSALLEAMQESQVSTDGQTRPLPSPFFVLATQNPHDRDGTQALPFSQLDRFAMRLSVGFPSRDAALTILRGQQTAPQRLVPILSQQLVASMIETARATYVDPVVEEYVLDLIDTTRNVDGLRPGASPRAAASLLACAKVRAAAAGRSGVWPDDVKALLIPTLAHRVSAQAAHSNETQRQQLLATLTQGFDRVAAPTAGASRA
jgi:MoxR-like ATPase